MATTAEIRNKAAKKLGLFGTGQTLRADITADLDAAYTEVYGEIEALGLATWSSTDDIPNQYVSSVVAWVAGLRVDEYSVPDNKYQRVKADFGVNASIPEARIRRLQAVPLHPETEIEYF